MYKRQVYDSSGKLQFQIEKGLDADVFFSAATTQMNALKDEDLVDADSISNVLENKLVLIKGKDSTTTVTGFDNIKDASIIAIGDPEVVPAGSYAKEALTNLGVWDSIQDRDVYKRQEIKRLVYLIDHEDICRKQYGMNRLNLQD